LLAQKPSERKPFDSQSPAFLSKVEPTPGDAVHLLLDSGAILIVEEKKVKVESLRGSAHQGSGVKASDAGGVTNLAP
jgi:hypothetical protein